MLQEVHRILMSVLHTVCFRYGSLFALYVGPHYTVVVNNHQHAREVLLQRGKDFAGRPSMVRHAVYIQRQSTECWLASYILNVLIFLRWPGRA